MSQPDSAPARNGFNYGVCYYPEAWPVERHAEDIARIADAGFTFVRMGESAWGYWEPAEGQFQFDLFDKVIALCEKHGLKVVLGTPTYTGPAWIAATYPEVLRWNFQRIPMKHGSRRNYTYSSSRYLDLSDRICTALAQHYAGVSAVVGWQLDNEFNCHMDVSYAPADTAAFRDWLRQKYGDIDALNHAWGTRFWSQQYDAWEQIDLPHPTSATPNPSQLLDESRFISDTVVRFARRQARILRSANSRWWLTHNALFANVSGPDLVADLDVWSHDQYPLFCGNWGSVAHPLVTARSLNRLTRRGTHRFAIMEQQSGPGGQLTYLHRTPRPGEIRLWAWEAVAHGCTTLSYFRWRTCPYGAEQHWHGILDPDNRDNSRLAEVRRAGSEIGRLPADFFDTPPDAGVAVLRGFDNDVNDARVDQFLSHGQNEHERWMWAFMRAGVPVDYVWPGSDWSGLRLLVVPHMQIITDELAARIETFVAAGGSVLVTALSGLKDHNNHLREMRPPGLLARLCGVEVEDWSTVPHGRSFSAEVEGLADPLALDTFVERLKPTDPATRILARWQGDDTLLSAGPAMTVRAAGDASVFYLGGFSPQPTCDGLALYLAQRLKLPSCGEADPSVEMVSRGRYVCLLNHSARPASVRLNRRPVRVIAGDIEPITGDTPITLPAFGIAVVG